MMEIYKITNKINGKIYIGQHRGNNPFYFGSGKILRKAILKYGKLNFEKEIIEICDDEDCLDSKEKYWISYYNSTNRDIGYNIREGGGLNGGHYDMNGSNNPNYGNKWSNEQRKKASDFWKGKTFEERIGKERAKELKRKKSEMYKGENNPMFGISPVKKECPICNKIVDIRNFNRWHGDKCRGKNYITYRDKYKPKNFAVEK